MSEPTSPVDPGALPPGVTPPSGGGGRFLSDVIVALGFADRETVDQALDASRAPGKKLGTSLVEMGVLSERQLGRAVAERYRLDFLDLSEFDIDPEAVHIIGDAEMRRYEAVPVAFTEDGALVVAMIDPADWLAAEEMAQLTGRRIRRAVAAPFEVLELINRVAETRAGGDGADDDGYDAETPVALPARLTLRPVSKPLANGALGRDPEPGRRPASVAPGGPLPHPPGSTPVEPKVQHPDEAATAADAVRASLAQAPSGPAEPSMVDESHPIGSADARQNDAERHEPAEAPAAQAGEGAEGQLAPATPTTDAEATEAVAEEPDSESPAAVTEVSVATPEVPPSTGGDPIEDSDEPSDDFDRQSQEPSGDLDRQSQEPSTEEDGRTFPVFGVASEAADAEIDPPALLFKPPATEPPSGSEPADADEDDIALSASPDAQGDEEASASELAPAEDVEVGPSAAADETLPAPARASSPDESEEAGVAAHELTEVRTELAGARAKLEESHAVLDRLRKELDAAREELATTRSRYDGALERAAESERLLAESRAHAGRLEAELAAAQEQARSLREDLTRAREVPAPPQNGAAPSWPNGASPPSNGTAPPFAPAAPATSFVGGLQPLRETVASPAHRASAPNGASAPAVAQPSADALPAPTAAAGENGQPDADAAADGGGSTKARGLKRLIAAVRRL